jgi:hypothetical protein
MKRNSTLFSIGTGNWIDELLKPLKSRPNFKQESDSINYDQIAARIIGTGYDETEYYSSLYEVSNEKNVYILSEILDKTIPNERFQAIQKIYEVIQREKGLSINRFVAFLEGQKLLPKHEIPSLNRRIREAMITVFRTFEQQHEQSFNDPDFRRVFVDVIKWTWNHLDSWINEVDLEVENPHILWYGEMNKSQKYFLYYVILMGLDVVILHPEGIDEFLSIDTENRVTTLATLPTTASMKPFPKEKPKRQGTIAYRASKEIDEVIHHDNSGIYKPWQLRNHLPRSVTLKTTYDEIFLIAKEKAFIRPDFSVTPNEVEIPSIFAKVSGVSSDRKDYWNKMTRLTEASNSMMINKFPFTEEKKANQIYHYKHALDSDGLLSPDKLIKASWWQYSYLHDGLQYGIAAAISRVCANPQLLPQHNESKEDLQLYLFSQVTDIPEEILNLLQKYDYSQEVPTIVLYNNEVNGNLSRSDAALVLLLNDFGVDIVVYNPPGHNDLEVYVNKDCFDTHLLEEMVFNLTYNDLEKESSSIFKRIIKQIF